MGMGADITQQLTYSIAAVKIAQYGIPTAITFISIVQIGPLLTISGTVFQNIAFHER